MRSGPEVMSPILESIYPAKGVLAHRMAAIKAAETGGITVVTLAAVQGGEFGNARACIFCEQLKGSESGLVAIRMFGTARDRPSDVISFTDVAVPPSVVTFEAPEA